MSSVVHAHLDAIVLGNEQILSLQIAMQAISRMKISDSPRYIDCKAQSESPRKVQVLIDNVSSQVSVGQVFRDDEDSAASGRRWLGVSCAVEC